MAASITRASAAACTRWATACRAPGRSRRPALVRTRRQRQEQGDIHGRVDHESLGSSLHQVGYCLSSPSQFTSARPWFERAVAAKEQGDVHGRVDHESLGSSLHQVGYCLSSQGQFAAARPGSSAPSRQRRRATFTAASITPASAADPS